MNLLHKKDFDFQKRNLLIVIALLFPATLAKVIISKQPLIYKY